MDVASWLRELGLERYEQAFLDNEIDTEILPKLTADDLKDIGVAVVGHRRRLLVAIAALAEQTPSPQTQPSPSTKTAPLARPAEPERRQLTVLFCDLVGSTALSAELDPEEMGKLLRAYQSSSADVVKRWDGHVAKFMGDGVLAYFGWPQAHEDDAERAARAGLELCEQTARLTAGDGKPLAARVGIATGLVMVGDLIGEGAAQEEAVVGETPNLAGRLQALAEPGSVVIDRQCRELVSGLFDYADLGRHNLKGFPTAIQAWRIIGDSRAESRFEALRGQQLTGLVGREHELSLLVDRWERAKEGEGQVVLLSGEPGIGKSRIVRSLRERLTDHPHLPLSHYCSPYHTNSALYPVIGLLERAAGLARGDRADVQLDKLEALLARGTDRLTDVVPLVAALLEIETKDRYPPLTLSPQRQKQRTLEVLVDQVEGLAAHQPVLAVYEDVHWIDPTTLETLGLLIERAQCLPVLVLITYRPEFSPPWSGHAHVMQLSLSRLSRRQGMALAQSVAGDQTLPANVLDQILAHADGVPLFVEELTKTVVESKQLKNVDDRRELAGSTATLAIPATLKDSLMARLDHLDEAKEVVQIAAAIGREFSHELLAAVAERLEPELAQALDRLIDSELVFRRGSTLNARYTFKHALVQDAAYQSLLKSKRQQLHTKIASVLKAQFPDTVEIQPELVGHHLTRAGLAEPAIGYWKRAAERALQKSANLEAVGHYQMAIELLASLPQSSDRDRIEVDLQLGLGTALTAPSSYAADEVRLAFTRAEKLTLSKDDTARRFRALRGLWNWHLLRANLDEAKRLADELLNLTEQSGEPTRQVMARRVAGTTSCGLGNYKAAKEHFANGLKLYDPNDQDDYVRLYGEDPGLLCYVYLALTASWLGHCDQASIWLRRGLVTARSKKNQYSLSFFLAISGFMYIDRREPEEVRRFTEEASIVSQEQGFAQWLAAAQVYHGWAMAALGDIGKGLEEASQGVRAWYDLGGVYAYPNHLTMLADIHRMSGDYEAGLKALDEADTIVSDVGFGQWLPELYRVRGEILVLQSHMVEAEKQFSRAIDIACDQNAKSLQLRAAVSLARLWCSQDKGSQARGLLAPIFGWFTEGFDTTDLIEAKALLDKLS